MYCETSEVIEMFKEDMLNNIIGEGFIEDVDEREKKFINLAETAIKDADAEIDGYLSKRYTVPFTPVPKTLNKFSKDIAAYNLASRMGIDESDREKTYLNRYNAAISFLTNVAKGIIDIGASGNPASAESIFKMRSSERLFSRKTLKGW